MRSGVGQRVGRVTGEVVPQQWAMRMEQVTLAACRHARATGDWRSCESGSRAQPLDRRSRALIAGCGRGGLVRMAFEAVFALLRGVIVGGLADRHREMTGLARRFEMARRMPE